MHSAIIFIGRVHDHLDPMIFWVHDHLVHSMIKSAVAPSPPLYEPISYIFLGMIAVRENRYVVLAKDFEKAYKNQLKNKDEMEHEFYH